MSTAPSQTSAPPTFTSTGATNHQQQQNDIEEVYVVPWVGILAIGPRGLVNAQYTSVSRAEERAWLTKHGLHPSKVEPLWNQHGYSGFTLVHFDNTWTGFSHLMDFEKSFIGEQHDKEGYMSKPITNDGTLYGWPATADDFHASNIIGSTLRKKGDLKTVREIQAEQQQKDARLISELTNKLDSQNENETILLKQIQLKEALLKLAKKQQQQTEAMHLALLNFQRVLIIKQRLQLEIHCLQITLRTLSQISATEDSPEHRKQLLDTKVALKEKEVDYVAYNHFYQMLQATL